MTALLSIVLSSTREQYRSREPIALRGTFTNIGTQPLALTFWWNRRMRIVDDRGAIVAPGPGPVLPCGVAEELTILAPGEAHERAEPLACTQPAGRREAIGWAYALGSGRYRVTLVFESPPAHGFAQSPGDPRVFRGTVESNELAIVVA